MEKLNQRAIAKTLNISTGFVSEIFSGKKRPSWDIAKRIAEVTGTNPVLWMEGSPEEKRNAISHSHLKCECCGGEK